MTSPFGPLVVIANPRAGRGKVEAALPRVERVLRVDSMAVEVEASSAEGVDAAAARAEPVPAEPSGASPQSVQ